LRRGYGVIVSDVIPGGPAEAAGLKIGDILVGADDRPTDTLPALYAAMYLHPIDEVLKIAVKRGSEQKTLYIPVLEHRDQMDKLMDAVDPEKSLVPRLGILAIDLNEQFRALVEDLRNSQWSGRRRPCRRTPLPDTGLRAGDVIHTLNTHAHRFRRLTACHYGRPEAKLAVVLQVERDGKLQWLTFEME